MENTLTFKDITLLLMQKKKLILIITLIASILFGSYSFITKFNDSSESTMESSQSLTEQNYNLEKLINTDIDLLTEDELIFIENNLFEDAYSFRIYIEHQDGSVYDRTNLLTELLLSKEVINNIEETTSVEIESLEDYFLNVELNSSNVIYTITIGAGNRRDNELVSEAYYDLLQNGQIEVISNKVTKLFEEPQLVESEEQEEATIQETTEENGLISVLISILVGALSGFLIGVVSAFIVSSVEKKITPIYNYRLTELDTFTNFSHIKSSEEELYGSLMHTVLYPTTNRKLLVSQNKGLNQKLNSSLGEKLKNQSVVTSKVTDVDPSSEFDEIIIITENLLTDKNWYNSQVSQLRVYGLPIKVIKLK